MSIKFGTDGWRAVISDEFTFANVRLVAQAIAEVLRSRSDGTGADGGRPLVVVGFDTRFLSDRYAIAVSEVLAANGLHVMLAKADAPTPVISYAIPFHGAIGGVMITASHNPPRYNGIKMKADYGGSASNADTRQVEATITANLEAAREPAFMELADAQTEGLIARFDPFPTYREHLWRLIDREKIRRAGLHIVVDAMYGSGRGYLQRLLSECGVDVVEIRGEMNPGFNGIHPEPIARHLQPLIERVLEEKAVMGVAMDGDADRTGAVGNTGRFIDPHGIMALTTRYLVQERGLRGAIVKTVSTTQMLNQLAERYGLPLHETAVGFNYISDLMLSEDVLIGGEESGGITIKGHIPEGDGVLMGMMLAEIVAHYGKPLDELLVDLAEEIGSYAYARNDFAVRPFEKPILVSKLLALAPEEIQGVALSSVQTLDGVKYVLVDNSWLLIRPSGTEPVLRVYAEAQSQERVQALLTEGRTLANAAGV